MAGVGLGDVGGDDEVFPGWMEGAEDLEVFGIEPVGVPFALDGIDNTPTTGEDEINLVLVCVAPIPDLGFGGIREETVEDEVFPEQAASV